MKQMKVEQLFVEGKYMVVYLSPETAVYDELGYYLWNKDGKICRDGASLLYLDLSPSLNRLNLE